MKHLLLAALFLPTAIPALAQTADLWSDSLGVPGTVGAGGAVVSADATTIYVVRGANGQEFYRGLLGATRTWTRLADVPIAVTAGGSAALRPGSGTIFVTSGKNASNKRGFHRYDIATNTWTSRAALPFDADDGVAIAATAERVYALGGASSAGSFHEYAPDSDSWTASTPTPAATGAGAALAASDGILYALRGGGATEFWAFAAGSWSVRRAAPTAVVAGGALASRSAGVLLALTGDPGDPLPAAAGLHRYDAAQDRWTQLGASTMPGPTGAGAGIACGSDSVEIVRGGSTSHAWTYSLSDDRFRSALSPAPALLGPGASMASADGMIFVLRGGGTAAFHSYSPDEDRWSALADLPAPEVAGANASLVPAGPYVYALLGKGASPATATVTSVSILRYARVAAGDQEAGTWRVLTPFRSSVLGVTGFSTLNAGAWAGGDRIYMPMTTLAGYTKISVLGYYTISTDRWTQHGQFLPATADNGVAMVYPGTGDYLYLYEGNSGFHVYCVSRENQGGTTNGPWDIRTDGTPFRPADMNFGIYSKSLAFCPSPSGAELHALPGNAMLDGEAGQYLLAPGAFWVYSIAANTWTQKTSAPGSIGQGVSMVSLPGQPFTYAIPGTRSRTLWMRGPLGPPDPPTGLQQKRIDGSKVIPQGETIRAGALSFEASITHAPNLKARLEVEISSSAGTIAIQGPLQAATLHRLSKTDLAVAGYTWRARSLSAGGTPSDWVEGGAFVVGPNAAATATAIGQARLADGSTLSLGGATADGVRLVGIPVDGDVDAARLEFEIRPAAETFRGLPTSSSPLATSGAMTFAEERLEPGDYAWQVRTVDEWGLASAWTRFGGGTGSRVAFQVLGPGSTSQSSCLHSGGTAGSWLPLAALLIAVRRARPARA